MLLKSTIVDTSLEINLGNLPVIVTCKKWNLAVTEDFLPVIFVIVFYFLPINV